MVTDTSIENQFRYLLDHKDVMIESLFTIEDKSRRRVPFVLNPIQRMAYESQTTRDITVKPAQVGFSSYMLALRLADTVTNPGTNTVLIAYEDFITERLLSKADFYYNNLLTLNIPGFPKAKHDSSYEKTYEFVVDGVVVSKSSIYISSARSAVAGRAETIHHLLADEHAFWMKGSTERILVPALDRVPHDGTVDIFSTPNGEDNDFAQMYKLAKDGKSSFRAHCYTWFQHPEYRVRVEDPRTGQLKRFWSDIDSKEFRLTSDEVILIEAKKLTYEQIRWRRWKILEKESIKLNGGTRLLFPQEFPEDDVSCFLGSGDMYFDVTTMDRLSNSCFEAPYHFETTHVWFRPEDLEGWRIEVCIDPGQAKNTETAISVIAFKDNIVRFCARDLGLYLPELTSNKAKALARYYKNAKISWEANSHGLALSTQSLLGGYRPIYFRKDVVNGKVSTEPGWLTTPKNKEFMMNMVQRYMQDIECHDLELVRQMRNVRINSDGKIEHQGASDLLMSYAIGLVCHDTNKVRRGFVGSNPGWKFH